MLSKTEKVEFIESIMDMLKNEILSKVDRMPEEWSGIQLRQYIVDYAKENVIWSGMEMDRKSKKVYNIDVLMRGL